jgi:hypothetical protein
MSVGFGTRLMVRRDEPQSKIFHKTAFGDHIMTGITPERDPKQSQQTSVTSMVLPHFSSLWLYTIQVASFQ